MKKYSFKSRILSFKYAFRGIFILIQKEPHAQIHLLASVIVVTAGYCLAISSFEWIAILFCIAAVLSLEALNTALENLADAITGEQNYLIGMAKDIAAGAVLIMAIASSIIATIIFLPKLL